MTLSFLITTAVRKLRRNKIRFVIGDPHFDGPYKTGALSPISSMSFPASQRAREGLLGIYFLCFLAGCKSTGTSCPPRRSQYLVLQWRIRCCGIRRKISPGRWSRIWITYLCSRSGSRRRDGGDPSPTAGRCRRLRHRLAGSGNQTWRAGHLSGTGRERRGRTA